MFEESDESGDDSFDEEFESTTHGDVPKVPAVAVGAKHVKQLREVLGLDAFERKREARVRKKKAQKARRKLATGGAVIETIASRQAGHPAAELVAYTDYRKLKKSRVAGEVTGLEVDRAGQRPPGGQEVTLQQARFEVFKLGVSAMDKTAKEDAQTALAIRLGAKPAKEKGLPYAELKEKRAKEKEELLLKEEERKNSMAGVQKKTKGSLDKGKAGKVKSKKKSSSGMKVGSFDGGMLKLSSKELSRLKGKK